MARKIKNIFLAISLFAVVLLVWYSASVLHLIPQWFLPTPIETFSALAKLVLGGNLNGLMAASFLNVIPAFLFSVIISLVLGVLIGMSETFRKIFSPLLSAVYLVPSLAWLPLIILFLGFSRSSIWAIVFISSFIRIIYSVIGGVRGINPTWLMTAKNFEMGRTRTVMKVIFPGALPQILSGVRVGFGSAWRSLIGAEMLVVTAGGLGKYIWMSQWAFKFDQVFAGIFVIAAIGIVAEYLIFKKIEEWTLIRWGMMQQI